MHSLTLTCSPMLLLDLSRGSMHNPCTQGGNPAKWGLMFSDQNKYQTFKAYTMSTTEFVNVWMVRRALQLS